jgi:hypothetical protein
MNRDRLVVVGVLIVLLAASGTGGLWWWKEQPKQLYLAAEQSYKQGEQLLPSDPAAAKQAFLNADAKLARILDPKKDPKNGLALLKRYKVQMQLFWIYKKAQDVESLQLAEKAWNDAQQYAQQAAADKKNIPAQMLLLDQRFKADKLGDALTYADNLLDANVEQDEEFVKNYPTEVAAAHFLKGQAALRADPPREDETLNHVKACWEIEKKVAGPKETPKARWREIDLEARALKSKADAAKTRASGVKAPKDDSLAVLQAKLPDWIKRAHDELTKVEVPAEGEQPARPGVVLLPPTNLRGFFSVLNLSIELASTPEDVVDRANLMLDNCDALIGAKSLTPKTVKFVNELLTQLPKTLKNQPVCE